MSRSGLRIERPPVPELFEARPEPRLPKVRGKRRRLRVGHWRGCGEAEDGSRGTSPFLVYAPGVGVPLEASPPEAGPR